MRWLACVLIVLQAPWTAEAAASAGPRKVAVIELRSQVAPASCIDVNAQTGQVSLWSCHGGANQRLEQYDDGTLRHSGRCLVAEGTSVLLKACARAPESHWVVARGEVRNRTDRCLDVAGGQKANGTPIVAWNCQGGAQQQWTVR